MTEDLRPQPFKDVMSRVVCFFFQAEDGIRDADVTGVQTCALPIFLRRLQAPLRARRERQSVGAEPHRSEERRVGKECRCRWAEHGLNKDEVDRALSVLAGTSG